ncbi:MAG TPA: hypothetical protein VFE68_21060 [Vicinamibacteria bacterium]|nr:hypothetical protein [Vicinamibacteria bacterium]
MVRRLARRPETALFVLALGVYAYFFQAGGWNQNAHFDLTRAIVEQHTVVLDDYIANTGDWSVANHHYYSNKAPGLGLLAVPVYGAVHPLAHGNRVRGWVVHLGAYLSTVICVALPAAVAVGMLFRVALVMGGPPAAAAGLCVAWAFGTLALPYATLLYSHQLTASLLFIAFALLVTARAAGRFSAPRMLAVGLLLGLAVAAEYPCALAAAVIAAYALAVVRPRQRLAWAALGAGLPLLLLAAYHTAAFGGPLTTGYGATGDRARDGGLFLGVALPSARVLGKVVLSPGRGLLTHAPWLILGVLGAIRFIQDRARRAEGLACLGVIVMGLAFNSSLTQPGDWAAGRGIGTRHLVPSLPFYVLGLVGLIGGWWRRPRVRAVIAAAFLALVAISARRMLVATAVLPEPPLVDLPFEEYLLPRWREGQVAVNTIPIHTGPLNADPTAWNIGQKMGLAGRMSLLPLGGFAFMAGAWLTWAVRRTDAIERLE